MMHEAGWPTDEEASLNDGDGDNSFAGSLLFEVDSGPPPTEDIFGSEDIVTI